MRRLTAAVLVATIVSGCASLQETFGSDKSNKVYIGTKKDWNNIFQEQCGAALVCEGLNPIVDLPLSFVMDTLLLPYTVTHRFTQSDSKKDTTSDTAKPSS